MIQVIVDNSTLHTEKSFRGKTSRDSRKMNV